jgi:hypothetical protein
MLTNTKLKLAPWEIRQVIAIELELSTGFRPIGHRDWERDKNHKATCCDFCRNN